MTDRNLFKELKQSIEEFDAHEVGEVALRTKRILQIDENIVSAVSAFINHGIDPGTCTRLLLQGRHEEAYLNAHPLIKPYWEDHVAFIERLPKECRGENYEKWAAAKLHELHGLNMPEPKEAVRFSEWLANFQETEEYKRDSFHWDNMARAAYVAALKRAAEIVKEEQERPLCMCFAGCPECTDRPGILQRIEAEMEEAKSC